MKKIKFLLAAVAILFSGVTMAQKITCPNVTLENGKANLTFSIESNQESTLAEFFLTMPEGISIEERSGGRYRYTKGEMPTEDHTVTIQKREEGDIYVLLKNEYGDNFLTTSGTLITLPIVAADGLADGIYQISVKDVLIADTTPKQLNTETEFTINVTKGSTGINGVSAEGAEADGKYLKNGEIIIKKGNKEYNAIGAIKK